MKSVLLALLLLGVVAGCDPRKCVTCYGKGEVKCPLCTRGRVDCAICVAGESAGIRCKFCQGRGDTECISCKGAASLECRRCKGTGK